jgi:hypothetical protein
MAYKDIKDFYKWQSKRRDKYRKDINEIKFKIGSCKICGYHEHPEILQFHHREKKEKKFKFSVGNLGDIKWERILEEIKKCDLICPNCHFLLHYNETAKKYCSIPSRTETTGA